MKKKYENNFIYELVETNWKNVGKSVKLD